MSNTEFLTILLTVTYCLGCAVSVTDREFEALSLRVEKLVEMFQDQLRINQHLKQENKMIIEFNKKLLNNLHADYILEIEYHVNPESIQNHTIEERVALLEIQVVEIEEDISILIENDNFLFDGQIIQDEKLLNLEQETDAIIEDLGVIDDDLEGLQAITLALDFRVTVLEENGDSNGNSSVAELEGRVDALEETVADHESTISTTESVVTDLELSVAVQQIRLETVEENINDLQITDVELDVRLTALEENADGSPQNVTIAFNAALTSYSGIAEDTPVLFNEVVFNEGEGYDSTTGTFTVPPGGDGYYYFSVYLTADAPEICYFDITINGLRICTAYSNLLSSPGTDSEATSCSGATFAVEGDTVKVVYMEGTDTTPLMISSSYINGFSGFKI